MPPGGCISRRSRLAAFVGVVVISLCLPMASPAFAGTVDVGESGSGMPAYPVIYPASTTPARLSTAYGTEITFADVTKESHGWAKAAIKWVGSTNAWMLDFPPKDGTYYFRPDAIARRRYVARAIVRAFAPDEIPNPEIVLADMTPTSPFYRFAAVAVDHGWMVAKQGAFRPDDGVTMAELHRALVLALGLGDAARGLNRMHMRDGTTFRTAPNFGTTVLGMRLFLRYNAPTGSEGMDVDPRDVLTRSQVAYSLWRATTQPSWAVPDLLTQYGDVQLPNLGKRGQAIVRWGIRWAGYPYVWGGEWGFDRPAPSAFGGQPRSGFDCTGFVWWLLRRDDGGSWEISPPRPYVGWSLPQRVSADMAAMTTTRIRYGDLRPGDIMFYDGNRDGTVDHADVYIGNGYALDSSSTPGGVTIMWVGDGWYREHFTFGRRIFS